MAKDFEKKEIRSDKVRKIIEEEPPLIIRYGTIFISLILLGITILVLFHIMAV